MDWQKTGDTDSQNAVNLLSKNGAYGNSPIGRFADEARSREVAYALDAKWTAKRPVFFAQSAACGLCDGGYRARINGSRRETMSALRRSCTD